MPSHSASVPIDHPCLAGHFPGNPVVPAVMLLEFVGMALASELGAGVRVTAFPTAKFTYPLRPGEPFDVTLDVDRAQQRARFVCRTAAALVAQGSVRYEPR